MSPFDLSVLFFLQLAAILATCRACGLVFRHFGQRPSRSCSGFASSAWCFTDLIQVYAVFGAFVVGLTMPRGRLAAE